MSGILTGERPPGKTRFQIIPDAALLPSRGSEKGVIKSRLSLVPLGNPSPVNGGRLYPSDSSLAKAPNIPMPHPQVSFKPGQTHSYMAVVFYQCRKHTTDSLGSGCLVFKVQHRKRIRV